MPAHRSPSRPAHSRTLLVTGAAGGIGGAVAALARQKGYHVVAAHLPDMPPGTSGPGMSLLPLDVGDTNSVATAFSKLDDLLGPGRPLTDVIHCAAMAPFGPVELSSPDALVELVNVNTAGTLRIIQGAVPRLRDAGGGRILLLSSLWGRLSGPMVSHYAATKHAIEALVDSARREFGQWGIELVLIEPGVIATPMVAEQAQTINARADALSQEDARLYGKLYRSYAKLLVKAYAGATPPDVVAAKLIKVLEGRKCALRYPVGLDAHLTIALARLLPGRWLDAIFRSQLPR